MDNCIFCKIVRGEIPSTKAYEDEDVLVFNDIHPIAPVHLLLIPKAHVESLAHCGAEHQAVLGKMLLLAPKLAKAHGLDNGFRTMINTGRGGGQEVDHLHLHVFGGSEKIPRI
jgi:histidine triad (HIT) family protein